MSKALFLSPSLSRQAGGIFEIMHALARHLQAGGTGVEAMGLQDGSWESSRGEWGEVPATVYGSIGPRAFGYSRDLKQAVLTSQADILHLHALWMYPSVLAHQWHRHTGRPYVVTPNGMLEPWALANSAWKKRLAEAVYERRMLQGAACLQANTLKELQDFRNYGLANPVAVIPNGIELPDLPRSGGEQGASRILLFLGRLHPKKGLVDALQAWQRHITSPKQKSVAERWIFVIAGWDQGGHEEELKGLCATLRLSHRTIPAADLPRANGEGMLAHGSVVFTGAAFGSTKTSLLHTAEAFVLPSFSEGLPMAVLEAWAHGLPAVITPECNLPEGVAAGAAVEITSHQSDRPSAIQSSLDTLIGMSRPERQHMGAMGRQLVETHYSWTKVARELRAVYEWILGRGPQPGCIVLSS